MYRENTSNQRDTTSPREEKPPTDKVVPKMIIALHF